MSADAVLNLISGLVFGLSGLWLAWCARQEIKRHNAEIERKWRGGGNP